MVSPEKQANERRVNILAGANNGQELILTLDIVYKSVEIIQYTIQTDSVTFDPRSWKSFNQFDSRTIRQDSILNAIHSVLVRNKKYCFFKLLNTVKLAFFVWGVLFCDRSKSFKTFDLNEKPFRIKNPEGQKSWPVVLKMPYFVRFLISEITK